MFQYVRDPRRSNGISVDFCGSAKDVKRKRVQCSKPSRAHFSSTRVGQPREGQTHANKDT